MTIQAYAHLRVDTTDAGVRTITLDRPDRLNAVNTRLADELPDAIDAAALDDNVRVIVITGAGRAFCAGLDLNDPGAIDTGSRAQRLDPLRWVGKWVLALTHCDKPVVAAVNGAAAGAGFGLALACDLRIISAGASCTAGYVRRGLSPDAGVSWFLPRLVGMSRAMDIILTGRDVDASEAERIGLASRVFAAEVFAEQVANYAAALAHGPPLALALSKRLLLASSTTTLESQLHAELANIKSCFASNDVREAMRAFAEKRTPVFKGD